MAPLPEKNTTLEEIPCVDLLLAPDVVADQWDYAFRTYGFCYLKNHGLEEIYGKFAGCCRRFFQDMSAEEKEKYDLKKGYGAGGYTRPGVEAVSASGDAASARKIADPVESLCCSSADTVEVWPCTALGYDDGDVFVQCKKELFNKLDAIILPTSAST